MTRKTLVLSALLALSVTASLAAERDVPDLRVTQFTVEQVRSVSVPLRVKAAVMMKNYGGATGDAPYVTRLSYRQKRSDAWQTLEEWKGHPLTEGGGARYEQFYDLPLTGRVTLTFRVVLDAEGQVKEHSRGNNTRTVTESFYAGVPDLAVEDLEAGIAKITSKGAWHTKVQFDVANVGTGRAQGPFVTVLKVCRDDGGYTEIARWTLSNLAPGARHHFKESAVFSDVESLKFFVSVDDGQAVMEKENQNNTAYSDLVEPEEGAEED